MTNLIDFAELASVAGDAIVISDASGRIVFWNPSAERIFGFSEAEALGQTLDLITPERHRQRHWTGYHKTMKTGHTRYGAELLRVPALSKEGRPLSIAFTVAMLRGADDAVTAIAAIIRDETSRWAQERDLRRRVSELEGAAAQASQQENQVST